MSIITYPLNAIEYTAGDAETYLSTRTSGVFSDDISITPQNMTVTIGKFLAWIKNGEFTGKSVAVTAPVVLNIEPAEVVLKRIDRIVLRFDASQNSSNLIVLKGAAASNPVPTEITRTSAIYDLCLADIAVNPGITEITAENITSQILNNDLCGIMRDGVTGIPTGQLQNQAEELIQRLRDTIDSVLSDSAFVMKDTDGVLNISSLLFSSGTISIKHRTDSAGDVLIFGGTNLTDGAALMLSGENGVYGKGGFSLSAHDGTNLSGLQGFPNGTLFWNEGLLFGEHNKPNGVYVGDGSTSERSIRVLPSETTGGAVLIHSAGTFAIVTPGGAILVDENKGTVRTGSAKVFYEHGTISMASNDAEINKSNVIYSYSVLY